MAARTVRPRGPSRDATLGVRGREGCDWGSASSPGRRRRDRGGIASADGLQVNTPSNPQGRSAGTTARTARVRAPARSFSSVRGRRTGAPRSRCARATGSWCAYRSRAPSAARSSSQQDRWLRRGTRSDRTHSMDTNTRRSSGLAVRSSPSARQDLPCFGKLDHRAPLLARRRCGVGRSSANREDP
jgi:hypothetical protein